jgi:thiol-disulfide isomerase/thioredoxin
LRASGARIASLWACVLVLSTACTVTPRAAPPATRVLTSTPAASGDVATASPTRYAFAGPISTRTAIALSWPTPTLIEPYEIVEHGQPHFIEFYAWWCPSCTEMLPSVRQLEQQYKDRVDFHILNVDHAANRAIVYKYRAYGIPLTVLLDAKGLVVRRIRGHQDEAALTAALEWLLALPDCPTASPPPPACDVC